MLGTIGAFYQFKPAQGRSVLVATYEESCADL
jgi:hypothetical protein